MSEYGQYEFASFHEWLLGKINEVVSDPNMQIRVSGITRTVDEEDFGFSSKTRKKWRKDSPTDPYPDGKKIKDIVYSEGFQLFDVATQHTIACIWFREELQADSVDLSDELIGTLLSCMEKSPPEFLLKCVMEVRNL